MSDIQTPFEPTFEKMVTAAGALGGAYSAEISVSYHAGVTNGKQWLCSVEADIHNGIFGIWSSTPQNAVELTISEALRRLPGEDNSAMEVVPEWYSRDAWVLASTFLGGHGGEVDLPNLLGASRQASNPSVFIACNEFGWAVSRLVPGGLLQSTGPAFEPSDRARELWQRANEGFPNLSGYGFTKRLLEEMQSDGPAASSDMRNWTISERTYLDAIQAYIERSRQS